MKLAVTVGFDARLVVRALANIPGRDVVLVRGATGGEGDAKSREAAAEIIKALGRGAEYVVDIRDPAVGLRQLYDLQFDEIALAGGPRLLVVLGFVAAAVKGAKIYVVPEYGSEVVDVSGLAALGRLAALSSAKLAVLASIDGEADAETVARRLGLDPSTVYRHLDSLEEIGVVRSKGRRGKKYEVDKLVATLSSLFLEKKRGSAVL
ncbi:MAG: CRISPR-associated CARF protein Csa3 [Pyrobaculum arsenaticum]|uniref:CRISPR-associated HTH regulatory protein, Csa3 family n=2 Tax=Pyrobaculum arsenaticum TaxID=121277 RepID=A4WJY6_PYRAR|nr:CRISPR-associated CARF protein Csa3 [Pyrobaculum arsenaticum]ABP50703.1 CRISPR-associated HTH regulatory protein, Csa3 family [Pyrobaculum arsenaticum DSM 13514]MCY0890617.1 CRISPR-associated CARF protein Csa3 [Pyrobaculum arsenaticum]NYR15574.1 CRISPR locus-related DNA-binding protein [Pyrobaculum arsenaticum]